MLSNVVSAYYKAFGQTFIRDDQFLSMVGAITSVFNCSGRVLYGLVMDRWAYKVSMSLEAVLLILLMSTFYLTSLIGVPGDMEPVCAELVSNLTSATTATSTTAWLVVMIVIRLVVGGDMVLGSFGGFGN